MTKVGQKTLPSFHDFLTSKTMSTRGSHKQEPDASLPELAEVNFLPPWLPEALRGTKSDGATPLQDSLSPWPKLCLELILIRLKNGFYRSKLQLRKDIIEAYANSFLLCLAPVAKQKKSPISIKKLAGVLASRKYAQPSGDHGQKIKDPKPSHTKAPKVSEKKASPKKPKKQAALVDGKGKKAAPKVRKAVLSEMENTWLSRLESVRRLYATALVCTSEIAHVGHLFGLKSLQVPRPDLRQKMIVSSPADEQAARVRCLLAVLVSALGRDLCMNRYPMRPHDSPTMRLKLTVEGETIKGEQALPKAASSGSPKDKQVLPKATSSGSPDDKQQALPKTEPSGPPKAESSEPTLGEQAVPKAEPPSGSALEEAVPKEEPSESTTISAGPEAGLVASNQRIASTSTLATGTSNTKAVVDCVSFGRKDYEGNESLIRMFFGKNGRLGPCIRCQGAKRSMFYCRGMCS